MSAQSGSVAGALLREAAGIVEGVRNEQHGHKERSFAAIARRWRNHIRERYGVDVELDARDVGQMMMELKLARANHGQPARDHFLDIAGYAGCAWEVTAPAAVNSGPFPFSVGDKVVPRRAWCGEAPETISFIAPTREYPVRVDSGWYKPEELKVAEPVANDAAPQHGLPRRVRHRTTGAVGTLHEMDTLRAYVEFGSGHDGWYPVIDLEPAE